MLLLQGGGVRGVVGGSDGEVYSEGSAQRPEPQLTESVLICRDLILSHGQHGPERACASANAGLSVLSAARRIYTRPLFISGTTAVCTLQLSKRPPEKCLTGK